jgi:hypothetical protein
VSCRSYDTVVTPSGYQIAARGTLPAGRTSKKVRTLKKPTLKKPKPFAPRDSTPDDPAVLAAIDPVRWELSLLLGFQG